MEDDLSQVPTEDLQARVDVVRGRPDWTLDDKPDDRETLRRVKDFMGTHAVAGVDWEEVSERFQKQFPGIDPDEDSYNRFGREMRLGFAKKDVESGVTRSIDPVERAAVNVVPFVGPAVNVAVKRAYGQARERYQKGEPTAEDYKTIARYEHEQGQTQEFQKSWGGSLMSSAFSAAGFAGEMGIGGAALTGAARLAPRALGFLAPEAVGLAARPLLSAAGAAQAGGQAAARAVTTPAWYAERAAEINLEHGRDAADPRGLPIPVLQATIQSALFSVANVAGAKAFSGEGVPAAIGRAAVTGAVGTLEQAAADPFVGAVEAGVRQFLPSIAAKETHYGTVVDLLNGKGGEALKQATGQFLAFAGMAFFHGKPGEAQKAVDDLTKTLDQSAKGGLSPKGAAQNVQESHKRNRDRLDAERDALIRQEASALEAQGMSSKEAQSLAEEQNPKLIYSGIGDYKTQRDEYLAPSPKGPAQKLTLPPEIAPERTGSPVPRPADEVTQRPSEAVPTPPEQAGATQLRQVLTNIFGTVGEDGGGFKFQSGDREGTVEMETDGGRQYLRIDFGYPEPELDLSRPVRPALTGRVSQLPKNVQPGSLALAKQLTSLARWAADQGVGLSFEAEAKRRGTYDRILKGLGFTREEGRSERFPRYRSPEQAGATVPAPEAVREPERPVTAPEQPPGESGDSVDRRGAGRPSQGMWDLLKGEHPDWTTEQLGQEAARQAEAARGRVKELEVDPQTGLKSRILFAEDARTHGGHTSIYDIPGLGAFNKFGDQAGDALIQAYGEAMKQAGIEGYRKGGDELGAFFKSAEDQKALGDKLEDILLNTEITWKDENGAVVTAKGGFGLARSDGSTLAEAQARLNTAKETASERGFRAKEGGKVLPPRLTVETEGRGGEKGPEAQRQGDADDQGRGQDVQRPGEPVATESPDSPAMRPITKATSEALLEEVQSHPGLTAQQRKVLKARLPDADGNNASFAVIGKAIGVKRERVKEIEDEVLKKLNYEGSIEELLAAQSEDANLQERLGRAGKHRESQEPVVRELYDEFGQPLPEDERFIISELYDDFGQPLAEHKKVRLGGGQPEAGETQPRPQDELALANRVIDEQRVKEGLPPMLETVAKGDPVLWGEAMQRLQENRNADVETVAEILKNPRPATDVEDVLILRRQTALRNEYAKIRNDYIREFQKPKDQRSDAALDALEKREAQLIDLINLADTAARVSGREWGRSGRARQLLMKEDFTLGGIMARARSAKGKDLTDAEKQRLTELTDQVQSLEAKLAEAQEKASKAEADRAITAMPKPPGESHDSPGPKAAPPSQKWSTKAKAEFDSAWADFTKAAGGLYANPLDPNIYAAMVKVAGKAIKLGVAKVGDFVTEIRARSAKWSDEHEEAVTRAFAQAQEEVRQVTRDDRMGRVDANNPRSLSRAAQALAKEFVAQGLGDRDAVIDAVHGELLSIAPGLTRREAMDAISGYGDFRPLSQEEAAVKLRDLKGQMQQVGKIEDMQKGQPPKKTGPERREPTATERELIQQVNDLKKQLGIQTTDPATQLKSTLDASKTRMRNQIEDLADQIAKGEQRRREKGQGPTDAELDMLRRVRDRLREDFDNAFGKPGMTDEQRLRVATEAVQRSIDGYEQRIKDKDFSRRQGLAVSTPELEALRARRDALAEEFQALRDADPSYQAEQRDAALRNRKADLLDQVAELKGQLARGEFPERTTKDRVRDAETDRLEFERDQVRKQIQREIERIKESQQGRAMKALRFTGKTLSLMRSMMLGGDLMPLLRQEMTGLLSHPVVTIKSNLKSLRAMVSEFSAHGVLKEISERDNAKNGLYKRALNLDLDDVHGTNEFMRSSWIRNVPVFAGLDRLTSTSLTRLRADLFDTATAALSRTGTPTEAEAKVIGNAVNVLTGRAHLGEFEQTIGKLNNFFLAPSWRVSRFQSLLLQPIWHTGVGGPAARARKYVAMEYARMATGGLLLYGLARMAAAATDTEMTIETDPRSSDFMEFRLGKLRLNPLAGLQQVVTFASRMATGQKKVDRKVQETDTMRELGSYTRNALAPLPGAAWNAADIERKKVQPGRPKTYGELALSMVAPLSLEDTREAVKELGWPAGLAVGLWSALGGGAEVYEGKKSR